MKPEMMAPPHMASHRFRTRFSVLKSWEMEIDIGNWKREKRDLCRGVTPKNVLPTKGLGFYIRVAVPRFYHITPTSTSNLPSVCLVDGKSEDVKFPYPPTKMKQNNFNFAKLPALSYNENKSNWRVANNTTLHPNRRGLK